MAWWCMLGNFAHCSVSCKDRTAPAILPPTLLFVTTGNISNDELLALFRGNLPAITAALAVHAFVEIDRTGITVRM